MPTINPLLYDENSEAEVATTRGAEVITPPTPGAFEGTMDAFGMTLRNDARAFWNDSAERVRREMSGGNVKSYEDLGNVEALQPAKLERIDPHKVGAAAQVIGPMAADMSLMLLPGGIATAAQVSGTRERETNYQELRAQGVDEATARTSSEMKGIETTAMWGLNTIPFAGQISKIGSTALRWGTRATVGAATTTGLDFIGGESRAAILERHGYTKQAEELRRWDGMRIASDVVTGAMLGLASGAHKPYSADEDAAARAVRDADHLQTESAPGLPTTAQAEGATVEATLKAGDDIANGQPVDVGGVQGIHDAEFLHYVPGREEAGLHAEIAHAQQSIDTVTKLRDETLATIDKARRDGMDDIAEHLTENDLPDYQNSLRAFELQRDRHVDRLEQLRNPERNPLGDEARAAAQDHLDDMTAARNAADELKPKEEATTPAAQAQAAPPKADIATAAREKLEGYRNPQPEAPAAAGEAKAPEAPKLTPAQQELVDHHHALRQLADATGDAELHAELDEAMKAHGLQHAESDQFNVAALCAIGG